MTSQQVFCNARELLEIHKVDNVSLTAEVLLRHVLHMTRVRFYQEPDFELTPDQETAFFNLIHRHINGEPVAYLTGHKEFYGLDFFIDHRVLIPRPETELLVEKALVVAKTRHIKSVADVGTGSGALAISFASYLKPSQIFAVDSSPEAIEVARLNSIKHGADNRITFLLGDLLEPLPVAVDMIVANLPYVKSSELNESSILFEPQTALDGGMDGLDQIRRFIPQVRDKLSKGGFVLLEIGQEQCQAVVSLIKERYPYTRIEVLTDFNKIERVICFY